MQDSTNPSVDSGFETDTSRRQFWDETVEKDGQRNSPPTRPKSRLDHEEPIFGSSKDPNKFHYSGYRTYDYEQKYPPDELGKEAEPEARIWRVYLDEAESYDEDMLRAFRGTIDSLLILAGLFAGVVTEFVIETSRTLRPDYGELTVKLLVDQVNLLKATRNGTKLDNLELSGVNSQTNTITSTDVWVNGLFFMSLTLAMTTVLLSVLARQWIQAYSALSPGSSMDRALVRQFRFDGLMKWKLEEIINTLPLILHTAFAIFLIGLSLYVSKICSPVAWVIIAISAISFAAYIGSVLLPAIWLDCPFRISVLYKPSQLLLWLARLLSFPLVRSIIIPVFLCSAMLLIVLLKLITKLIPHPSVDFDLYHWLDKLLPKLDVSGVLDENIGPFNCQSLRSAEYYALQPPPTEHPNSWTFRSSVQSRSLSWLQSLSSNKSISRIFAQSVHGILVTKCILPSKHAESWEINYLRLGCFLSSIPTDAAISTAFQGLWDSHDGEGHLWLDLLRCIYIASKSPPNEEHIDIRLGDIRTAFNTQLNHELRRAAEFHRLPHLEIMLSLGANISWIYQDGANVLLDAVTHGHIDVVRVFWDHMEDVNICIGGKTLLTLASRHRHLDIVRHLLDRGARVDVPNIREQTPLQIASYEGHVDVGDLLLEHGADINLATGDSGTPLQAASFGGHLDMVNHLIELGADIHVGGGKFETPLQAASFNGHLDVIDLLLIQGAKVNHKGGTCYTALHAAALGGHEETAELLLEHGAKVNIKGGKYGTALQASCSRRRAQCGIVKLLLDWGADVNAQTGDFKTALIAASWYGNSAAVKLLLESGADPSLKNSTVGSAFEAAKQSRHRNTSNVLLTLKDFGVMA